MIVFGIVQSLGLRSRLRIGAGPLRRRSQPSIYGIEFDHDAIQYVASPTARIEALGRACTAAGLCGLVLATTSARRLSCSVRLPSAHKLTSVGSAHCRDV